MPLILPLLLSETRNLKKSGMRCPLFLTMVWNLSSCDLLTALVALSKKGWVHHWLQQNHDGLPQKAGFPQEKINEVHGAWFDPRYL